MKYLDQIDRAIRYIEENLSSDLIIDQVARESGISKWHFQRVFKAVTGETIKSYTMSRKIAIAARELLQTEKKIIDIGLELNFDSHEVFSRAFQRIMEVSPSQFRNQNKAGQYSN